jgi:hypothetical protein
MKLAKTAATLTLLAGLMACGKSGVDADAKQLADLQCKAQKLSAQALTNPSMMQDSMKLIGEANELNARLTQKYTSDSDKAQLASAFSKVYPSTCTK